MLIKENIKIENDNEKIFIALDTETTGFSPVKNELIEVSAIKYKGKKEIDCFSSLIKPKVPVPYNITRITGIDNEMLKDAPGVEMIMKQLVEFIGKYPIVAHNANFDLGFLNQYSNGKFKQNEIIDTVKKNRKIAPHLPNHKLSTVAKFIGIEEEGYHRAEFDCQCCAQIYLKYLGLI